MVIYRRDVEVSQRVSESQIEEVLGWLDLVQWTAASFFGNVQRKALQEVCASHFVCVMGSCSSRACYLLQNTAKTVFLGATSLTTCVQPLSLTMSSAVQRPPKASSASCAK